MLRKEVGNRLLRAKAADLITWDKIETKAPIDDIYYSWMQ